MSKSASSFYIPSLDGIRAMAVMLVFLSHAGLNDRVPGNFGVTVFFFLSGYLITTLLRMEFDQVGRINLGAFYLRRVLRILPPMYLVLAAASLLTAVGFLQGSLDTSAVLAQVFHLSNYYIVQNGWWDGRAPGTWIYWSLAVEEHFYLVFPLVYLWLRRAVPSRKRQFWMLLGTCAAILAWRMVLTFALGAGKDRTYVASDTRVDSILFGCALAVYGNPVMDRIRLGERWWKFAFVPAGIIGLLVSFLITNPQFEQTGRYTLQGLALFPLFVSAIRFPEWLPFRMLNVGWVKFVGVLSYSFYLLHPTVLFAVFEWTTWHPIFQGVAGLTLALGLSVAVYYLVEKPCARLRKRLSRLGSRARTTKAASAAHPLPNSATASSAAAQAT